MLKRICASKPQPNQRKEWTSPPVPLFLRFFSVHAHLTDEDGPDAVSSCAETAEALERWFQAAYSLKPDWGRVPAPFRAKRKQPYCGMRENA